MVIVLLLTGIWQLAAGGWIHAKAWLAEHLIADAWAKTSRTGERMAPWSWADTWPVARLEVPRLGLSRYVLAGGHGRALAFGPGWLEGTTVPGGQGKSVISGHRDTHFRFLQRLKPGDLIHIHTAKGGRVDYHVTSWQILHEKAGWILSPDQRQQLILVTCYPFDALVPGGPWRYVVTTEVLESAPEQARI
jgi:sortase A